MDDLVTSKEAANILKCTRQNIARYVAEGVLHKVTNSKEGIYRRSEVLSLKANILKRRECELPLRLRKGSKVRKYDKSIKNDIAYKDGIVQRGTYIVTGYEKVNVKFTDNTVNDIPVNELVKLSSRIRLKE